MTSKGDISSLIGLAVKAGKVKFGSYACEGAIKSNKAMLTVTDPDMSKGSKKKFTDKCAFYGVPMVTVRELERVCGKPGCKVIVVTDAGFAGAITAKHETYK